MRLKELKALSPEDFDRYVLERLETAGPFAYPAHYPRALMNHIGIPNGLCSQVFISLRCLVAQGSVRRNEGTRRTVTGSRCKTYTNRMVHVQTRNQYEKPLVAAIIG